MHYGIHTFSVRSNISIIKGGNSPGISSRKCNTRSAPETRKYIELTLSILMDSSFWFGTKKNLG